MIILKKSKRTGNLNTRSKNIQSRHRNRIWHRKMCHASNENGIVLPNQDKIRTLGGKETYLYLGILEGDTIKQEKIQKKYLRRTRKLLVVDQ